MTGNRPQRTGRTLFLSPFLAAMLLLCLRIIARSPQQQDAIDRRIDLLLSQMTFDEKVRRIILFYRVVPENL
jgi:hypothetical protein